MLLETVVGASSLWMCRAVAEAVLPRMLTFLVILRKLTVSVCVCDDGMPGRADGYALKEPFLLEHGHACCSHPIAVMLCCCVSMWPPSH